MAELLSLNTMLVIGTTVGLTLAGRRLVLLLWHDNVKDVVKQAQAVYTQMVVPYLYWLEVGLYIGLVELGIWLLAQQYAWLLGLEYLSSLILTVVVGWALYRICQRFFDVFYIDAAVKTQQKVNSELLILGKYLAGIAIAIGAFVLYGELHHLNIVGLLAGLGIGGFAIAFAAQKTLEQLLGGIVIYIDRPFVIGDYIGLPDGVFGRVEMIGLRSTKIRTSGRGTVTVVPNSSLTQVAIENFTGAKKVMALSYLQFEQHLAEEERALVQQIILDSTRDVFGIDSRNTDISFVDEGGSTRVQVTFFILGSGQLSMELRRQVLIAANEAIATKLSNAGLVFRTTEPTVYVDAPITL